MTRWLNQDGDSPSALPSYDSCYVCGQANPVGLHVRFFAQLGGGASADFHPGPAFAGYDGVVHGGVISACSLPNRPRKSPRA